VSGLFSLIAVRPLRKNPDTWHGFATAFGDQGSALKIKELEVVGDFRQVVHVIWHSPGR